MIQARKTWSAWQYVYTPDGAPDRIDTGDRRADVGGLGLFARVGIADDDTNPIDYTVSAGIGGRGLIPGRDDDTFGLGFSYTDFDDTRLLTAAGFGDDAYAFEAFYNFDLGHGLLVTANAQVIDPWLSDAGTTTVLGTRLNVRF
jgi:porin